MVYLCLKPQEAASLDDLVHYERPPVIPVPEQVEEAAEVEAIDQVLGQLSVGNEIDSVSDVSTVSGSSAIEDLATPATAASLPRVNPSSESQGAFGHLCLNHQPH